MKGQSRRRKSAPNGQLSQLASLPVRNPEAAGISEQDWFRGNFAHIFLFWLFFCVESCCKRKQKTKNKRIQPKTFSLWNKIFSRDEFIFTTWGCRCVAPHTKEIHGVFWIYDFWYTHTTLTLIVLLPATSNSERTNWPSVLINFKWLEFFAIFSQQSFSEGNWKPSFFVC